MADHPPAAVLVDAYAQEMATAAPGALPPEMLVTFAVSSIAVLLFALVLVGYRYRLEGLRDRLAEAIDR